MTTAGDDVCVTLSLFLLAVLLPSCASHHHRGVAGAFITRLMCLMPGCGSLLPCAFHSELPHSSPPGRLRQHPGNSPFMLTGQLVPRHKMRWEFPVSTMSKCHSVLQARSCSPKTWSQARPWPGHVGFIHTCSFARPASLLHPRHGLTHICC